MLAVSLGMIFVSCCFNNNSWNDLFHLAIISSRRDNRSSRFNYFSMFKSRNCIFKLLHIASMYSVSIYQIISKVESLFKNFVHSSLRIIRKIYCSSKIYIYQYNRYRYLYICKFSKYFSNEFLKKKYSKRIFWTIFKIISKYLHTDKIYIALVVSRVCKFIHLIHILGNLGSGRFNYHFPRASSSI